jgi:hypothetical protein
VQRRIVRFSTALTNSILFFFKTYRGELLGFKTVPINSITLIFNICRGLLGLSTAPTNFILLIFKACRGVAFIFCAAKIRYSN